jgi:hypothetical protein
MPGSSVRDRGGGLRIVNGRFGPEYDYKYQELPPDDDAPQLRGGRFGGRRGTW